jgi:hypothetical protein
MAGDAQATVSSAIHSANGSLADQQVRMAEDVDLWWVRSD